MVYLTPFKTENFSSEINNFKINTTFHSNYGMSSENINDKGDLN